MGNDTECHLRILILYLILKMSDLCPVYAPFFGSIGCAAAIVFTCFGASYGTAKSGVGICATCVLRPDLLVKNIVPVIMAGIIAIYGLVVSVLLSDSLKQQQPLYSGFIQLGAGLSVGPVWLLVSPSVLLVTLVSEVPLSTKIVRWND